MEDVRRDRTCSQRLASLACCIVLTHLLAGCNAYHVYRKCGLEGCAGDAQVESQVKAALRESLALDLSEIHVQSLDHVVYLYGLADTEFQRSVIESVTSRASGGARIVNSIAIKGNDR
jgi:osmotically-inducible protein OsmY